MPRATTTEFSLLVACCRWPLSPAACDAVAAAVPGIDWALFAGLAARHRVEGLASRALAAAQVAPPADTRSLADASVQIARQNLSIAAESIQLHRAFADAGVDALFVKGITLGKLAYGDIVRKAGWDIDLLVAPRDLVATAAVLRQRGYRLTVPETPDPEADLPRWHDHAKESVWHRADGGFWVELHTALTDNPALLPGVTLSSPRREVEISPGLSLPTLAHDELVAYLCVHGASSAWFRLKWIADLAALIGAESEEEIERLYQRSQRLGAGRAAAQAFLLADRLFGIALPEALRTALLADRVNRWLLAIALRKLVGRGGAVELDEIALGTATIHLAQFGLRRDWRYKRLQLSRLLVSPVDRLHTPLPPALRWLYPAVQLARLARSRSSP